jgi:hypothetical protein
MKPTDQYTGDLSPVKWALRPASFAVDLVSGLLTLYLFSVRISESPHPLRTSETSQTWDRPAKIQGTVTWERQRRVFSIGGILTYPFR